MSAEVILFVPRPNRKRYISLARQAKQIMAQISHPHENAVNADEPQPKEPA